MTNYQYVMSLARFATKAMTFCGIVGFFALWMYLVGPELEAKYLPVVTEVRVTELVPSSPDRIALQIYLNKERGYCKRVGINALAGSAVAPEKAEVFKPLDDASVRRPSGWQSLGVWEFKPAGDYVKLVVDFKCHGLWNTSQKIFEWRRTDQK